MNGGAFYRSADGGVHWEQAVQGMAGIEPRRVVPAPERAKTRLEHFMAVDGAVHSNDRRARAYGAGLETSSEMWTRRSIDPR